MIFLLAIIVIESGVIAWLYHTLRKTRRQHVIYASAWLRGILQCEREIATLRDEINKARRNTGKAER